MRAAFVALFLCACGTTVAENPEARPARWAQPVPGTPLENLHKVSAELYRCEQPSADDMRALEALGIRSVVNLRAFHTDRDEVGSTSLELREVPMRAGSLEHD